MIEGIGLRVLKVLRILRMISGAGKGLGSHSPVQVLVFGCRCFC